VRGAPGSVGERRAPRRPPATLPTAGFNVSRFGLGTGERVSGGACVKLVSDDPPQLTVAAAPHRQPAVHPTREAVLFLYFASVRSVTGTICVAAPPRLGGAAATSPVLTSWRTSATRQFGARADWRRLCRQATRRALGARRRTGRGGRGEVRAAGTHGGRPAAVTASTRRAPPLPLRCGGGTRPCPGGGGGRDATHAWTCLCWGGSHALPLACTPPLLCTCRWGRRRAGRYKTGRAAAHCRAVGAAASISSRASPLTPRSKRLPSQDPIPWGSVVDVTIWTGRLAGRPPW